jgi:hypothetical protein
VELHDERTVIPKIVGDQSPQKDDVSVSAIDTICCWITGIDRRTQMRLDAVRIYGLQIRPANWFSNLVKLREIGSGTGAFAP